MFDIYLELRIYRVFLYLFFIKLVVYFNISFPYYQHSVSKCGSQSLLSLLFHKFIDWEASPCKTSCQQLTCISSTSVQFFCCWNSIFLFRMHLFKSVFSPLVNPTVCPSLHSALWFVTSKDKNLVCLSGLNLCKHPPTKPNLLWLPSTLIPYIITRLSLIMFNLFDLKWNETTQQATESLLSLDEGCLNWPLNGSNGDVYCILFILLLLQLLSLTHS